MTDLRHDGELDEQARRAALTYASCTMHYIRAETADWSFTDFAASPLKPQTLAMPGHIGRPPIDIDRRAQERFEEVVDRHQRSPEFGRVVKLGEESSVPNWDPQQSGPAAIVRCDPIDGTASLAHSADGYASVVTIEWRAGPGQSWRHYGGAIVRHDGHAISWSRRGAFSHDVIIDPRQRLDSTERPQRQDFGVLPALMSRDQSPEQRTQVARSGAAVAAQTSERRRVLLKRFPRLVTEAEYFDFKAGTPTIWPLAQGMLGFVVELNPTTIHDSIHLFPFMLLGGRVVDHDFRAIDVKQIIEANAGPEATLKVFPPYFGYANDEALDFIRAHVSN